MPPLAWGQYLIEWFFEFGPTKGEGPIDAESLVAWEHLLGVEWTPYEARLLIRLSRSYLGEMHRATKRDAKPPWAKFEAPWRWVQNQKSERRLSAFLK